MMKIQLISTSCLESAPAQSRISNSPSEAAYTVCLRRVRYVCGAARMRLSHIPNEKETVMSGGGAEQAKSVGTPPYTSYRTFKTFIEDLREHGVPSRIDRSVLDALFRRGRHAAHARASLPRSH